MRSSIVPLVLYTAAIGCGGTEGLTAADAPEAVGQPIQGGQIDQADPAVVAIFINTGTSAAICTGTLIAPNLVLSAHHCVAPTGAINSCTTSPFGNLYSASSFYVTSSYIAAANAFNHGVLPRVDGVTWFGVRSVAVPGNSICGNDVSVLELSTSLRGICPLMPRVDYAVSRNEGYRAVGFGITSPTGQAAGTRYSVSGMTAYCAGQCGGGTHPTLEWVGGASTARGTCEGDSGGPALDSLGRVIGTVSRGPANACNNTVYESVFGNATWIKTQAQTAATNGHYSPAAWVTGGNTGDTNSGYCPTGSGGGAGGGGGSSSGGGAGGGAPSS
ncbi:MAG: S1 family peptidase, partial [Myxococcaceae bacterium]|nr:S1 family peptidase [Myxococcaceae bacterium]